jgi:amidase
MLRSTYRSAFVPHDIDTPIHGAASGPLAGLTAAVKDMYDVAGYVAGCGNPTWLATHQPATRNAGAVQAILDAGAAIVGKTICDEFFYSVTGANHHYGTPINARAPGRLPGGSSSGSASAVGAGLCDFALGSDTGGSVRVPASFNGIYGLRPTTAASTSPACRRWRARSTCRAGSPRRPACSAMSAPCCSTAAAPPPPCSAS